MKSMWALSAALLTLSAAVPASAALVEYRYDGFVAFVFGPDPDGVAPGDIAHVRLRFDNAHLVDITDAANAAYAPPTPYTNLWAAPLTKPGDLLDITVGPNHFTAADEIPGAQLGPIAGPFVLFNGGNFFGIQYFGVNPALSAFVTSGAAPEPFDFVGGNVLVGGPSYAGYFDYTRATSHAVPEPATWALMIAGFGLAGAALRRRATRPIHQA